MNENKDVIRHEDTTVNLPSTSRNGQVTFETDGTHRQRRVMLAGTPEKHWTPNEDFTADIPAYTNPAIPGVANVSQMLDYLVTNVNHFLEPVLDIYDNTSALPPTPTTGDRYIALTTANGWTVNCIYTWDGSNWIEFIPTTGDAVIDTQNDGQPIMFMYFKNYNGTYWAMILDEFKLVEDDSGYITITKVGNTLELGFDDHGAYAIGGYWPNPIISIFDNTSALPAGPSIGDRYIAKVTAHGWTINHVYEWNGSSWIESQPLIGAAVKDLTLKVQWHWDGTNWNLEAYIPTADQKAALAGTNGTPSVSNKYVTDSDSRNTNARTPTAHNLAGAEHNADTITNLNLKLSDGDVLSTKAAEISALTAKGTPTTSDILLIEDAADSNNKKKITIANLPAVAPTAHAIGGSAHSADTIANVNAKLSDGDMISTLAGEIAALTAKGTPTTSDILLIEDAAAANAKKKITISSLPAATPAAHASSHYVAGTDPISPRTTSIASSSTPTPNVDTTDMYVISALAVTATFGAPTGTPVNGQKLILRIYDNGTQRTLNWNAIYNTAGVTLPTTTTVGKYTYVGLLYNSTSVKWTAVAVNIG